jgi:Starter unit:ACP transacylase in aflatoxin biosynthesis
LSLSSRPKLGGLVDLSKNNIKIVPIDFGTDPSTSSFVVLFMMVDRIARPLSGNTILLFGPLALSFGEDSFHQIRSTLLETEDHQWILDTIAELPECLNTVIKECPKFQAAPGLKSLEDLNSWFKTGRIWQTPFRLPNILLNPLVVISQLTQYSKYLELANPKPEKGGDLYASSKHDRETLGFCTGLLSALAVSSSANRKQFQKYGAVALRLGMLIGMVVDTQDGLAETGEAVSFATVWNSVESGEEMARIVKSFPEVRQHRSRSSSSYNNLIELAGIHFCQL